MRQVDLEEYEPSTPVRLSVAERDALRAIPSLAVERADIEDSRAAYILKPGSTVGAAEVGDLSVLIKPKIPIPQLLSLACYAMSKFKPRPEMFDFSVQYALPDVLALALASTARRAFARGLLHGYRTKEEALHTVRGRIMFAEQIRRRFGIPLPVEVRYDEFTDDIRENRLVKAAAARLGRMRLRSRDARVGLGRTAAILDNVAPVDFPPSNVARGPVRPPERALPRRRWTVPAHSETQRIPVRTGTSARRRFPDGHEQGIPGVRDPSPAGCARGLRIHLWREEHPLAR